MACSEFEQALVHIDVDDLGAAYDLIARDIERGGEIAGFDQFPETRRASDIGALADIDETNVGGEREGLQTRQAQQRRDLWNCARRDAIHALGDCVDMRRRRAAAAADDIDETGVGKFADQRRHVFRAFVIKPKLVREPGVRIGANQCICDPRQFGEMRPHFACTQRAIKSDGERCGMAQRVPESCRCLPGQRTAGEIGDRAGDHHRQLAADLLEDIVDAGIGGLGVQRVEDRFDQQNVGASLDQRVRCFGIGSAQFVEGDRTKAGIVHIGRDRSRSIGRPHGARNEAGAPIFCLRLLDGFAAQARGLAIEFRHQTFHAVIRLSDPGRRKRVGRDDVGAGLSIGEVDGADCVGLRQHQKVIVAAQVARPVREPFAAKLSLAEFMRLDHRAHGAVEHEDAFAPGGAESFGGFGFAQVCLAHAASVSLPGFGRTPSKWQIAKTRSARFIV